MRFCSPVSSYSPLLPSSHHEKIYRKRMIKIPRSVWRNEWRKRFMSHFTSCWDILFVKLPGPACGRLRGLKWWYTVSKQREPTWLHTPVPLLFFPLPENFSLPFFPAKEYERRSVNVTLSQEPSEKSDPGRTGCHCGMNWEEFKKVGREVI